MLIEGVRLMVVGMATVFTFLGLLALAMHGNRIVAGWLAPDPGPPTGPRPGGDDNEADIAVVLAALAAMRRS